MNDSIENSLFGDWCICNDMTWHKLGIAICNSSLSKMWVTFLTYSWRHTKRQKPHSLVDSALNMHSVRIVQKSLHFVNVGELVSVKDTLRSALRLGGDRYPQMILVKGRLCIVLMETSLYYFKNCHKYIQHWLVCRTSAFCLLVRALYLIDLLYIFTQI